MKLRPPNSIEDAVHQAIGLLGADAIATALTTPFRTVSESLVAKWSDPDITANRLCLADALAIEMLLVKSQFAPIFAELFERLKPAEPEATAETPLAAAIRVSVDATALMDKADRAMADGACDAREVVALRAATVRLQDRIARFRRTLFVKPRGKKLGAS